MKNDGRSVFDQPINHDIRTYENIRKITTGRWVDYTFFLLNYHYFKENYKLIAIDWNKQQSVDADPGATD